MTHSGDMDTCEKLRCSCGSTALILYPSVRKPHITIAAECVVCGHMWYTEDAHVLLHLIDQPHHLLASA